MEKKKADYNAKKKKEKKVIIGIVIAILFFLGITGIMIYRKVYVPQIVFKKGSTITLNYKQKYKEPGFKVVLNGKNLSEYVTKKEIVNSEKIGNYKIIYILNYKDYQKEFIRNVKIRDISKPKITLVSNKDIYICPGGEYKEEKYKAYDNVDGDLTKKVKVLKTRDDITYSISDKAGNSTSTTRKIYYKDIEPPTIELNGSDINYAFLGEKYVDPSFKVKDNCDKGLATKVKVEGKVDTNKVGIYNIQYTVEDNSKNKTSVIRKVYVNEHNAKGTIYLTFDDGPKEGTTNIILDILRDEGIKATFFVMNAGPDELIKRMYDEGHTVALHTATHNYSYVYSSVENYFNDLYSVRDRVKRVTGEESNLIRFPGGGSNLISRKFTPGIMSFLTEEVIKRGFKYYDWNIDSGDAGSTIDATEVTSRVISQLSKERVNMVLLHDIKAHTRDGLRQIIIYGKTNGYIFEKITESTEMIRQKVSN